MLYTNVADKWRMQTVYTQIRLLLKEQSDQGLHCLPFLLPVSTLTLVLLNLDMSCLCKQCRSRSVDPDQLAPEEANWSGSTLFVIKYVNFYEQPSSSNLIGWKLEVDVAS